MNVLARAACAGAIAIAIVVTAACTTTELQTTTPDASDASEASDASGAKDAGKDAGGASRDATADTGPQDGGSNDAASCEGKAATSTGETCLGYGKGSPCDPACGRPYGYVCYVGGPPGVSNCRQLSATAFGETYCCAENACVRQPDQNARCSDAGTKTHYVACSLTDDGGTVAPPAGCVSADGPPPYAFYCCGS